jgi:hypothetical protein
VSPKKKGVFLGRTAFKIGDILPLASLLRLVMSLKMKKGPDHYRRERSKHLQKLAVDSQIVDPLLEDPVSAPAIARSARSKSSPNLFDMTREKEHAPKITPIAKPNQPSAPVPLPRINSSVSIEPQNRAAAVDPLAPAAPQFTLAFDTNPAFAKHLENLHFLIPGRLAYVVMPPDAISTMKDHARCMNVSMVSSHLHKQYVPLCADFGPVALNVVHRFCKVHARHLYFPTMLGSSRRWN